MGHSLDVVPVGVDNEAAVIVGMIMRPKARRPVVLAAGGNRRIVEGLNFRPVLRRKSNVQPAFQRRPGTEPELRSLASEARVTRVILFREFDFPEEPDAQRRQRIGVVNH